MIITMRNIWCRVVTDCVCDRGVTSGTVVQLGCGSIVWFSGGSVVAQLWFRLVLHYDLYGVALVQP